MVLHDGFETPFDSLFSSHAEIWAQVTGGAMLRTNCRQD